MCMCPCEQYIIFRELPCKYSDRFMYKILQECKMGLRLLVKCPIPLSDCNRIWIFPKDLNKCAQCRISRKSVQWESSWYLADRRTDMAKLIGDFREFCGRSCNGCVVMNGTWIVTSCYEINALLILRLLYFSHFGRVRIFAKSATYLRLARLSACIERLTLDRFMRNLVLLTFMKTCRSSNLVKIWQKSRELHSKTYVGFVFFFFAGDIKSSQKRSLWVKWYQAVNPSVFVSVLLSLIVPNRNCVVYNFFFTPKVLCHIFPKLWPLLPKVGIASFQAMFTLLSQTGRS
jgi:hypothetical protein